MWRCMTPEGRDILQQEPYLYFCTSKASKLGVHGVRHPSTVTSSNKSPQATLCVIDRQLDSDTYTLP
jgi:hypothetical protein